MGNKCAKCICENKEAVLSQYGGGANEAGADSSTHIWTNNILLSTLIAICLLATLFFMYKQYQNCHTRTIRREIREDALKRIRLRLSGRNQEGSENQASSHV